MSARRNILLAGLSAVILAGCDYTGPAERSNYSAAVTDVLALPEVTYNYANAPLPAHFRTTAAEQLDNTPVDNPLTDDGATLGRVLFYEKDLSANGTISCASCHVQENGFSDPNQFSTGFEGELTGRNSMSIANSRFHPTGFFWDERAASLEEQALMPIQSQVEMGLDLPTLVQRVESKEYMLELFEKAFGDREVTSDRIGKALAQFMRAMVSCDTRFDRGLSQVTSFDQDFPVFTQQENRGKQLFVETSCASCHIAQREEIGNLALFVIDQPRNIGLDSGPVAGDNGLGDVTGNAEDNGMFKVPSLRNVEVSGPYMHDGRLSTLDEVIEFYNSAVRPHPNLDPELKDENGNPRLLNLTQEDKDALRAFLETLTDEKLLSDPKFADPFL